MACTVHSSKQHCPHAISSKVRRGGVFCKCNFFGYNCTIARLLDTNTLCQESIGADLMAPSFLQSIDLEDLPTRIPIIKEDVGKRQSMAILSMGLLASTSIYEKYIYSAK